jgi:hypothetical protein
MVPSGTERSVVVDTAAIGPDQPDWHAEARKLEIDVAEDELAGDRIDGIRHPAVSARSAARGGRHAEAALHAGDRVRADRMELNRAAERTGRGLQEVEIDRPLWSEAIHDTRKRGDVGPRTVIAELVVERVTGIAADLLAWRDGQGELGRLAVGRRADDAAEDRVGPLVVADRGRTLLWLRARAADVHRADRERGHDAHHPTMIPHERVLRSVARVVNVEFGGEIVTVRKPDEIEVPR